MLLGSIAASVAGTITSTFCPEYITFNITTIPSAFRIEVAGDGVIFNLDTTGMTNMNGVRNVGVLPTGQAIYQIADGYIRKNTVLSITNATAAQLDIYGFSDSIGSLYNLHLTARALANTSFTMDDFAYVSFPSAGAADRFTITFADGTTEIMTRLELTSYLLYNQNNVTTRYNIDNFQRRIRYVQYIGTADQNVYYMRYNAIRGAVNQAPQG